jgi:hypothetical protein
MTELRKFGLLLARLGGNAECFFPTERTEALLHRREEGSCDAFLCLPSLCSKYMYRQSSLHTFDSPALDLTINPEYAKNIVYSTKIAHKFKQ